MAYSSKHLQIVYAVIVLHLQLNTFDGGFQSVCKVVRDISLTSSQFEEHLNDTHEWLNWKSETADLVFEKLHKHI